MTATIMLFNHDPILHEIKINGRAFKLADDLATTYERRELVKDTFYALLDLSDRAHRISEASELLVAAEDELRFLRERCAMLWQRNALLAAERDQQSRRALEWQNIAVGAQSMFEDGKAPARIQKWLEKELLRAKYVDDEESEQETDAASDVAAPTDSVE